MRLIDADALIDKTDDRYSLHEIGRRERDDIVDALEYAPTIQPEPLTDKEQRIFLAAIERERKVCKEVDDQYTHEPYEVLLTKVCSEIERKVKKALWN